MAAKKSPLTVEPIINRWIVENYIYQAVYLFENKQYDDVGALKEVLDSVLARHLEPTDVLLLKIKVFEFLCYINDGENPDPESNQARTPLESALMLLESMNQEFSIPQKDFNNVCSSLKEIMVGMLIKNNMFEKAREMLIKHFPKAMYDKKAIFMRLINKKSKIHEVIDQIDFQQFREEMFAFCRSVCPFSVPFLHKAAIQLIERKHVAQDGEASGSDEQEEAALSSNKQICTVQLLMGKPTIIQRTRLAAAYMALTAGPTERTFAQLEEEVEMEEQARMNELSLRLTPTPKKDTSRHSERDEFFQRASGSPLEASPADHPPQTDTIAQKQAGSFSKTPPVLSNRQLFTVARLVIEPDSQGASQELESDVTTEEAPQSPAMNNEKETQNQVTRKQGNNMSSRASTSSEGSSPDIGKAASSSEVNKKISVGKHSHKANNSLARRPKRLSSDSLDTEVPSKIQVKEPRKQLTTVPPHKNPRNCITDSSLDSSDEMDPPSPVPQTSSTPHKDSPQDPGPSLSKWKQFCKTATESKEVWSDEESYFTTKKRPKDESTISNSGKRRKWSDNETNKLKEGVRKFGEGNWTKIKAYYNFTDRTTVNLKDRWRTLKKLNQV